MDSLANSGPLHLGANPDVSSDEEAMVEGMLMTAVSDMGSD